MDNIPGKGTVESVVCMSSKPHLLEEEKQILGLVLYKSIQINKILFSTCFNIMKTNL